MEEEKIVDKEKVPGKIVVESCKKVKDIPNYQNVGGELLF
jgi:hypothetical protein